MAGLAAAAALPACGTVPAPMPPRIDTHHHFFSPTYVAALDKAGQAAPIIKNWSLNKTLDDMAKAGVATAMLSLTTPQVGFTDGANAPRLPRVAG